MEFFIIIQEKDRNTVFIQFSGSLTIMNLKNEMNGIKKALDDYTIFQISLNAVKEMDLAGYQLVKVLHDEIKRRKKDAKFFLGFNSAIKELFLRSGINLEKELA